MSVLRSIGYRHSHSTIEEFKNCPQKAVAKKIFKLEEKATDHLRKGLCTEYAIRYKLHRDPDDYNFRKYIERSWDDLNGEDDKFIQWCFDASKLGAECLEQRQLKRIKQYQREFSDHLKYFKFPLIGYGDFKINDINIDIKATSKMPSKPRWSHIKQQAKYWGMSGKKERFSLLYVTNKKVEFYDITQKELELGWEESLSDMRWIEHLDDLCETKQDWINLFPFPDTDSFYFSDENLKQQIITLWKGEQNAND